VPDSADDQDSPCKQIRCLHNHSLPCITMGLGNTLLSACVDGLAQKRRPGSLSVQRVQRMGSEDSRTRMMRRLHVQLPSAVNEALLREAVRRLRELATGADELGNSLSMASAPVVRTGRSSRL
jgi:hypothetical protein